MSKVNKVCDEWYIIIYVLNICMCVYVCIVYICNTNITLWMNKTIFRNSVKDEFIWGRTMWDVFSSKTATGSSFSASTFSPVPPLWRYCQVTLDIHYIYIYYYLCNFHLWENFNLQFSKILNYIDTYTDKCK